jgi:hypothetical protein
MPFKPETTSSRFKPEQADIGEPTFGEKAGALAYGGVTGLAGGLGELEKFGAYDVPEFLGFREKDQRDKLAGRETIFPTISEAEKVLKKAGIEKPREEVGGYKTAGEIIGGFGTSLPSMVRGGVKMLVGAPTATREAAAKTAEKLGFKLSPAQVRQAEPVGAQGATFYAEQNQRLANELASKGTGKQVKEIDADFIGGRLNDLGKQFDKLYKGKVFNIDKDAVDALQQIRAMEAQLPGVATVSPVAQTADEIVKNFDRLTNRKGAIPNTFGIEGEALQRIRNALTQKARGTTAANAREIYNLVDVIDASIAKNHKDVAKALDVIRPQYRNSIILEDLYRSGGIQGGDISLERLGNMLRTERGVVRKTGQEIDDLAALGRDLKLRAMWESAGGGTTAGEQTLKEALRTTMGVVPTATGLRTRAARGAQRFYATEPTTKAGKILKGERIPGAAATATGTATRPLQTEE